MILLKWTYALMILVVVVLKSNAQNIKDIDGNVYNTVSIGSQMWMVENLRTTHFRNGDEIGTTVPVGRDISKENSPVCHWAYGGKDNNVSTYGRLYTWYAVSDNRGVCPVGWHVPTDAEWTTMVNFLGGELAAYGKIKEAGQSHWTRYDTGTNETGFTALPGGLRNNSGSFSDIGSKGYWWSSSENGKYEAWYRLISFDISSVNRYLSLKRNGLSVRCVRTK